MGYRVCKSKGTIHEIGANGDSECGYARRIDPDNYADFRTKDEAEAFIREKRKRPHYCKCCNFGTALQIEADR